MSSTTLDGDVRIKYGIGPGNASLPIQAQSMGDLQDHAFRSVANDIRNDIDSVNCTDAKSSTNCIKLDGFGRLGVFDLQFPRSFIWLAREDVADNFSVDDWPKDRRDENEEQSTIRFEKMQVAVRTLLECIGEDVTREGLRDTPLRFTKALLDLTKGYRINVAETVNNALFTVDYHDMVIVRDIDVFSVCEHHMIPFTGKMHIGYMPKNAVIGLSKLPRIAEVFARRLQIQERLTKEVAQAIMTVADPHGVIVAMDSTHLCMAMRGVQKAGATTWTVHKRGWFQTDSRSCDDFMRVVCTGR